MEKEALRQQLEDMEDASEKWRAEKRRLNAEIDKLESELADAKAVVPAKRPAAAEQKRQPAAEPSGSQKPQEAAEKLRRATEEWNAERSKLVAKISHLEEAVVEAIDRAANPMRAVQSVREQFEIELGKVVKEKNELEQTYLRGRTGWEQEKLKMVGEMVKLRRYAQHTGRPLPRSNAPEANPKIRELENQLKESFARWNDERDELCAQIQKLEQNARQWADERRQLNDHAGQLQQAFLQAQARITEGETGLEKLREAENSFVAERSRMAAEIDQLQQQLEQQREQPAARASENLDQLRDQYEQRLQEVIQQKTHLAQDLEAARLSAAHTSSGPSDESVRAEVSRVEAVIGQINIAIEDPATPLPTVIRKNVEKAELDAYLRGILFSLGKRH